MAKLSLFDNKITAYLGERNKEIWKSTYSRRILTWVYSSALLKSKAFQYTNNNQLEDMMEEDAPFIISARIINLRGNVH